MRIDHLQYFLKVAETGSISAAAQQLFISQQGISDALKRVEAEWGITLFHRAKTGVTLTTSGKKILPYIKAIIDGYSALEQQIAIIGTEGISCDKIRLLGNSLFISGIVPELSKQLLLLNHNVSMQYQEMETTVMVEQIMHGNADAAVFAVRQMSWSNL